MTDFPTGNALYRQMQAGTDLNTWGSPNLNNNFVQADWIGQGWNLYTVSGSVAVTWANYGTANAFQNLMTKLTGPSGDGTLIAAATITLPSYQLRGVILNKTGQSITFGYATGTTVTIPNGGVGMIGGDASNIYNMAATYMGTGYTPSNNGDIANVLYVLAAIQAFSGSVNGLVYNSSTATVANYLSNVLTISGTGAVTASISKINGGTSSEQSQINIAVGSLALTDGGLQSASFIAAANTFYTCPVGGTITLPTATASRNKIGITIVGNGATTLSGTVNGLASYPILGNQTIIICDADATQGWL